MNIFQEMQKTSLRKYTKTIKSKKKKIKSTAAFEKCTIVMNCKKIIK